MPHPPRGTPGRTDPLLCCEPLGTEGELTPGPDDHNPYDDPQAPDPQLDSPEVRNPDPKVPEYAAPMPELDFLEPDPDVPPLF